jgi:DNA-binding Lrp family transcriptional regulator
MIIMKLETLNPHVMKIVAACRPEDTISAISRRINLSYGWTHHWVLELEKHGVFRRSGKRLFLKEKSRFYNEVLAFLRNTFKGDTHFHYNVLSLFGIKYCFTGTDAVLIWTDGGYNISRYRNHYPIFVKIAKSDSNIFRFYVSKLGLRGKIFYDVRFLEDFKVFYHNGTPVDSLEETIRFMRKYVYNFQPALEMVQEKYGKKLGVNYREAAAYA